MNINYHSVIKDVMGDISAEIYSAYVNSASLFGFDFYLAYSCPDYYHTIHRYRCEHVSSILNYDANEISQVIDKCYEIIFEIDTIPPEFIDEEYVIENL